MTENNAVNNVNAFAEICYFNEGTREEKVGLLVDTFRTDLKDNLEAFYSFEESLHALRRQIARDMVEFASRPNMIRDSFFGMAEDFERGLDDIIEDVSESPARAKLPEGFPSDFDVFNVAELGELTDKFNALDEKKNFDKIVQQGTVLLGDMANSLVQKIILNKEEIFDETRKELPETGEKVDLAIDTARRVEGVFGLLAEASAIAAEAAVKRGDQEGASLLQNVVEHMKETHAQVTAEVANSETLKTMVELNMHQFNEAAKIVGVKPIERKPRQQGLGF